MVSSSSGSSTTTTILSSKNSMRKRNRSSGTLCILTRRNKKRQRLHVILQAWQSESDNTNLRRDMMIEIMSVLQASFFRSGTISSSDFLKTKLPQMVRRLELSLYLNSSSLAEYSNPRSLKRRLQGLVVDLYYGSIATTTTNTIVPAVEKNPPSITRATSHHSFLNLIPEVEMNVLSFLSTVECFQLRQVSHCTYDSVPSLLTCIQVPVLALESSSLSSRSSFINVSSLEILSTNFTTKKFFNRCSKNAEATIIAFAKTKFYKFPNLQSLKMNNVFVNTKRLNGILHVANAIRTYCPKLRVWECDGNAIGNHGALAICSTGYGSIKYLSLANNYIGQAGARHLIQKFASLNLTSNAIIVDNILYDNNVILEDNY